MRLTTLPPVVVANAATLPAAFERAFGQSTLRRLHGESFNATPWANNRRAVSFELSVDNVPGEVRRFFCGNRLRVNTREVAAVTPESITLRVKMRMHFVGSELFIVRPRYRLERVRGPTSSTDSSGPNDSDHVLLHAEVESHALLPPPLCNVVEAFMDASARAQLQRFAQELQID